MQEQHNYCVPASIQMWRAYDGLPSLTQDYIWMALGGAPCDGVDAWIGVRQFTNSGSDATLDLVSPSFGDEFFARQMTSIDRFVPVMVIVNPFRNHVGMINGGSYSYTASTDRYTWSTVLFHDPAFGPNERFTSTDWTEFTCKQGFAYCGQIISDSAASGWASYFQAYGASIDLYDGTPCCQQEHQN
jgi:hypothetical protein